MLDRARRYGADSDAALFGELLLVGEFIVKATVGAFVAGLDDDRERHRYSLTHGIVRADGVGEWVSKFDEMLTGPASAHLASAMHEARKTFTERCGAGDWRHAAVLDLHTVLAGVNPDAQKLGEKVALRAWFPMFAELRNKTRGHGATTPATAARLVGSLSQTIQVMAERSPVFQLPWAYLHRNLSGRYRVVPIGGDEKAFENLKKAAASAGPNLADGIYYQAGRPRHVELLRTDLDVSDFFVPNGHFNGATFELHSLISDDRRREDAAPYLAAAGQRPPSDTEGAETLEVIGQAFTNLPILPATYVPRIDMERRIGEVVLNDRHPIVTLVGRGGIGKTSLTLRVLREIIEGDRFGAVIWFSARDIDLTGAGAKPVKPKVLTEHDIAKEYKRLIGKQPDEADEKRQPVELMGRHLRACPLGPTLFVFDNFETVRSPVDLFNWLDMNVRLPNKVLITSRFRDFKADYPIEVEGMEPEEAGRLVEETAQLLDIAGLIGHVQRDELVEQLDGHPYVIKIVLGEIANEGRYSRPERLIARKDDILDALFERTYTALSPTAARVFLTLSLWRSLVPRVAVEATLLRHKGDQADTGVAIEQLVRSSLVERTEAQDGAEFLEVPLTAALFGRRKAEVSPIRQLIEGDVAFLRDVGSTATTGLRHGLAPKVEAFFRRTARRIEAGEVSLDDMRDVLVFFANSFAPAWLHLSELEEEAGGEGSMQRASEAVRRFLETGPDSEKARHAWLRLERLYRTSDNAVGACGAFLRAAELVTPTLGDVSRMANFLNNAEEIKALDRDERVGFYGPIAQLLEDHLSELSATDLSRLAWLHLHVGDGARALQVAQRGLRLDVNNEHCRRLVAKLA